MKTVSAELLEEITRRLIAEFRPEQIILFGSHAWGIPDEDSDVDLLVITSHSNEKPSRRAARAYHSLRGVMVPIDILVKTRAEVDRYRHVLASLEHEVLERGKVLYGSSYP
jgi:predicted nucleotidyltransferase